MSTTGIEQPNLFSTPYFLRDRVGSKPYILHGTFDYYPSHEDCNPEAIRELFIQKNFQSKAHLYRYENICVFEKTPSSRYDWQVIKATAASLRIFLGTNIKTAVLLIALVPLALKLGIWIGAMYVAAAIYGFILPAIQQAQKPYLDKFVAYQSICQLPNSMKDFDLNELANRGTENGWIVPIILETIPRDQISNSQILLIGKHAIPIVSALQLMLTLNYQTNICPPGEIPHPCEIRMLNPGEKEKFLREVSTFFAINDSKKLQTCWNIKLADIDIHSYTPEIPNWDSFNDVQQVTILANLVEQILPIQRKQAFLRLLTDTIAQKYFDDDFRSMEYEIEIPTFSLVPNQEPLTLNDLEQLLRDQGIPEALIQQQLQRFRPEE